MRRLGILVTALSCLWAVPSAAQQVRLEFNDGSVTLRAENAPIRTILAEWSRRGGTRIVNGDRVAGGPVTLELMGVPELQALEILLRGVAGYMVGRREVTVTGPSLSQPSIFDRIHILPTSGAPAAPRAAAPAPAAIPRIPGPPRPPASIPDDPDFDSLDEEIPADVDAATGAIQRPGAAGGFPVARPVPSRGAAFPVVEADDDTGEPAQPSAPGNPFGAGATTTRPGVIVPPPAAPARGRSASEQAVGQDR